MRFVEIEPGRLTLREATAGTLRPGWSRVRVAACGVCGTDLHLLHGMQLPPGSSYPLRPGHEVAGTVVDPGDAPGAPPAGTPVLLHPLAPCGRCDACREGAEQRCARARVLGISDAGGLATEVDWPADRLVRADGLDLLTAAVLPDAVATAHHALAVGAPPPGAAIAVLGAGGVGTHFLQLARAKDPTARLAAVVQSAASAQRLADLGVHAHVGLAGAAKALRDHLGGRFDLVVDFTGSAAAPREGVRVLRYGGTLVVGSIVDEPLDLGHSATVVTRELRVLGAYTSALADLQAVADLVRAGALDLAASVTHRVPLSRAEDALKLLEERPPGMVRVVVVAD